MWNTQHAQRPPKSSRRNDPRRYHKHQQARPAPDPAGLPMLITNDALMRVNVVSTAVIGGLCWGFRWIPFDDRIEYFVDTVSYVVIELDPGS